MQVSGSSPDTHAHAEAVKLFPQAVLTAPPDRARYQEYVRRGEAATGPLRGTVVTDLQALMKWCAAQGHR
ncbi:hypothetical protein [Streptomyces yangpuensis]|uniref:hypothetical protein n=1 Tax=Streptomyces yangpuensis TaxID=1648182 RepID=UPI003717770C